MDTQMHWFVLEVNPEPWAIGDLSVGRKGGKVFPMVGRNNQLHMYKEAVKEALGDPQIFFEGKIYLELYFWRRRDAYKTPQSRGHRKHEADGTNLAKATEDALQGVLFKNDKDVAELHWKVVEQGEDVAPTVIIGIRNLMASDNVVNIPAGVLAIRDEFNAGQSNIWSGQDEMVQEF